MVVNFKFGLDLAGKRSQVQAKMQSVKQNVRKRAG